MREHTTFGGLLRSLREQHRMTQADLAGRFGLARSTLANIERGQYRPTPRLWLAICDSEPGWVHELSELYQQERDNGRRAVPTANGAAATEPFLGGPFEIQSIVYNYIFEESRSPNEVIEVRRVKATERGADSFGVLIEREGMPGYRLDQQALWGGELTETVLEEDGRTSMWRRFQFDRRLRRGQRHEFAMRSWVERDPEPGTVIQFRVTRPTLEVAISLAFHGSIRPSAAWAVGPIDQDVEETPPPQAQRLRLMPTGAVTARFKKPEPGRRYGLIWAW